MPNKRVFSRRQYGQLFWISLAIGLVWGILGAILIFPEGGLLPSKIVISISGVLGMGLTVGFASRFWLSGGAGALTGGFLVVLLQSVVWAIVILVLGLILTTVGFVVFSVFFSNLLDSEAFLLPFTVLFSLIETSVGVIFVTPMTMLLTVLIWRVWLNRQNQLKVP